MSPRMSFLAIAATVTVLLAGQFQSVRGQSTVTGQPASVAETKPACCAGQEPSATGDVYRPDQHSYRFPLLKRWLNHPSSGIPIYGVDNHPEVPMGNKMLRYCAPAVPPENLYATQRERW